jgi:peptidoglycan glycosyltransferase
MLLGFTLAGKLSARETLQPFVNALMRGRQGAVIASNPATGEVRAVWNPSVAFDQAFPPGSTAKLVAAAAALEEGAVSPTDRVYCRRTSELLGDAYHCSHPPAEGPFTLASALSNSCNYFFAELSLRLTSAQLAHEYAAFGFGSAVPGANPQAVTGQVRIGDSAVQKALATLGEAGVLVTPAQLLLAYAAIANRGPVYWSWPASPNVPGKARLIRRVKLRPSTFELVTSALIECVQSGSGHAAAVPGVVVAGKTGTASAIDQSGVTHAWFVGYAPASAPEIEVVVFLPRGTGARDAAPLAGKILKHYFECKERKP